MQCRRKPADVSICSPAAENHPRWRIQALTSRSVASLCPPVTFWERLLAATGAIHFATAWVRRGSVDRSAPNTQRAPFSPFKLLGNHDTSRRRGLTPAHPQMHAKPSIDWPRGPRSRVRNRAHRRAPGASAFGERGSVGGLDSIRRPWRLVI